ncbi:MAG TPA: GNAT family N-acetyltransferase [Gaiellaceae bacterium]|nr:GNAT family N-acetyltransferase [Gaiellaceae bacterium]
MKVRRLTDADVRDITAWRYEGRYSTYDVTGGISPGLGYFAVENDRRLVGYCCFGAEARVPGVGEEEGTLDVGYGLRPDLVGRGLSRSFIGAILAFGIEHHRPRRLRVLVLRWNERSRRAAERQGFELAGAHGDFDLLTRSVAVPAVDSRA